MIDLIPLPAEPVAPVAPVSPFAPVIQAGFVSVVVPLEYEVTVFDQIYFPFSHVGEVVCQPVVGAVVDDELLAY